MRREQDSSPSFNNSYHVEGTDDLAAFELSERIFSVVRGLRGEHFHGMELITTHTNHNHEELLENIDVYRGSWGKLHTGKEQLRKSLGSLRSYCYFCSIRKKYQRNGTLAFRDLTVAFDASLFFVYGVKNVANFYLTVFCFVHVLCYVEPYNSNSV